MDGAAFFLSFSILLFISAALLPDVLPIPPHHELYEARSVVLVALGAISLAIAVWQAARQPPVPVSGGGTVGTTTTTMPEPSSTLSPTEYEDPWTACVDLHTGRQSKCRVEDSATYYPVPDL